MSTAKSTQQTFLPTKKSILELSPTEVRNFFLKAESYCSLDLPPYLVFASLLANVNVLLQGKSLSDFSSNNPREHDDINYTILSNKDGKYAWRPFQLIHPALYVSLAHKITTKESWELICKRFSEFSENKKIRCLSIPIVSLSEKKDKAEQIFYWWQNVEQKSIELSLEYEYLLETDITDCYGSIYTHSIAWALHTKATAKTKANRQDNNLIGNIIDNHLQDMHHGQTNGIPQGSVLMDFIAEMILGYIDLELSKKLNANSITDYYILRYRDDYRIFVNNPQIGEMIVKLLSEIAIELGLKLNPAKTKDSNDVIQASIKSDKLSWMKSRKSEKNLQKHLLIIHDFAKRFPNSGSLVDALTKYHKRILKHKLAGHTVPIIAIISDIAYRNPRTYSICAAILSKLLTYLESEDEKREVIEKIKRKFSYIPNTGHMQIWLQRVTLPFSKSIDFEEPICKLVSGEDTHLWNIDWISSSQLKKAISASRIVDKNVLEKLEPVILPPEVELFASNATKGYYS